MKNNMEDEFKEITVSNVEQSQQLIEYGANPYLASNKKISKYPIFTVTDLLGILPKEINYSCDRKAFLYIQWEPKDKCWIADYKNEHIKIGLKFDYDFNNSTNAYFHSKLIDSLYNLTIWCIKNGYIKFA